MSHIQKKERWFASLEKAWEWRQSCSLGSAYRVFHGPGEALGCVELEGWTVDRFQDCYWVTEKASPFSSVTSETLQKSLQKCLADFYSARGAHFVGFFSREKEKGAELSQPTSLFGVVPSLGFQVEEGRRKFWIQFSQKHPGLFLDQVDLRNFLEQSMRGRRVLNAFAYTGSLTVAAALGGAESVVTLDLASSTLGWAQVNFRLNFLSPAQSECIGGDYFDWMKRFKRQGRLFDAILLDPPSFSRSKLGSFSVEKDLKKLHELAFHCLVPGGILATSVNAGSLSLRFYHQEVSTAAKNCGRTLKILREISLPITFPTSFESERDRYLKGWVLQVS